MRSLTHLPESMPLFPEILRGAGYYCSNNSKEDYNLRKTGRVWDESSNRAHWAPRKPGQPFFAVFNFTVTHESQVRRRPHTLKHDPTKVRVPAYHPDTPEVRRDWAQYHDKISEMDELAGRKLRELEEAGLADDTIVFYFGDHGPGLPRCKRWPYNSGLRVPLIIYVPDKFKQLARSDYVGGGKNDRLISFVDLAPTVLSLAGIPPPDWMQGRAFLGLHAAPPPQYLHGLRGRMDERYDLVRTARDERYVYIRNYMPHKIYGQHVAYMFQTPTTQVWKRLFDKGRLTEAQAAFWKSKPAEELYDLQSDPDEVRNLANSAQHQEILSRLRRAQQEHALKIRDVGFLPEGEIHARSEGRTPYEFAQDREHYPLERILDTAERASSGKAADLTLLKERLGDADSAVRHWAALGILMRGQPGVAACLGDLDLALSDSSEYVRINAAEALVAYGETAQAERARRILIDLADASKHGLFVAMWALNAIDELGPKTESLRPAVRRLPTESEGFDRRFSEYVPRLIQDIGRN